MKNIYLFLISTFSITLFGQEQINENMPFQTDPSKDYSIVVPSTYEDGNSTAAFLALHPFNTSRWNGQTWCEELAEFAETNNVILICPDGGPDGKIDDPIDTAFTSFLLDSAFIWYDIDPTKLYAIGFSWGGKTTYTYGLHNIEKFAGLLPIGAAISVSEINTIDQNAEGVPVYIVHGSQDSPSIRFYPLLSAMEDNGACVESNLLQGVGHTIDFENQVEILTEAYNYLQDNECTITSTKEISEVINLLDYNQIRKGSEVNLNIKEGVNWQVFSKDGNLISSGSKPKMVASMTSGLYIIHSEKQSQPFIVF